MLLFVLLCCQEAFADDTLSLLPSDYSQGMTAYMTGDFERSQIHWLNAAKQNDPKSMFNLGLLHEQGKISGVDLEKAETWYRLAGKLGYAPADFHLVNLLLVDNSLAETNSEDILALVERAANNGFAPAQSLLTELTGKESKNSLLTARAPNTNLVSKQPIYLTEEWIATKESSNWTIQILAFKDQDKVHEFIDRHGLNNSASYFIETSQTGVLYKLIYGSFQSKQEAEKARENLSVELKEHGPWLRTIASVQALITAN